MSMTEHNITINGLEVHATYHDRAVNEIFLPLLHHLTDMHQRKGKRILAMLAAPPGAGKSTLLSFLERLSQEQPDITGIQGIGMDGFHRRQEYLLDHYVERDDKQISMVEIKGAPITCDLESLTDSVKRVAAGDICGWTVYDRTLHNPVPDAITVDGEIVVLEGNYLLLDEDGWRDLSAYADYTISVTADEELLRNRLIERKARTVDDRETAIRFVDFSDMPNARICLDHTLPADLQLRIDDTGDYYRL